MMLGVEIGLTMIVLEVVTGAVVVDVTVDVVATGVTVTCGLLVIRIAGYILG